MSKGKTINVVSYDRKKDLDGICKKAETLGIYNVESERRGVAYMYDSDEIAVVTCRGHIQMSLDAARDLTDELRGLIEDIDDLKRMECRI